MSTAAHQHFVPFLIVPDQNPAMCHIQTYPGSLTLCGMNGGQPEPLHPGCYINGYCTGCGKRACKTCEIMEYPL